MGITTDKKFADWMFKKMQLGHEETWSGDHLDRDRTVKEILKLINRSKG